VNANIWQLRVQVKSQMRGDTVLLIKIVRLGKCAAQTAGNMRFA